MNNKIYLKPTVVISKCLEHGHCRYDSSQAKSPFVKTLALYANLITVCPEVEIGLPIPREAIRVIKSDNEHKLVTSMSGQDISLRMKTYTDKFISEYSKKNIHGFILKSKSPSCGIKDVKVYKAAGKSPSLEGKVSGFFGGMILDSFEGLAVEDEGRLTNYNIREHFLTRIYAYSSFEEVLKSDSLKNLIKFHSHNKYLLMAYHQKYQKDLGRIVANHDRKKNDVILKEYFITLTKALEKPLRRGTNINMLMHLLGYFKDKLTKEEKVYFLDVLEQYSLNKVPFSVPITLIHSWVVRFDDPYLKTQTIFSPFPREILNVTDSGKGIN